MNDDNDTADNARFPVSRREALALIGAGGAATAIPGIATAAQDEGSSGGGPTRKWNQDIDAQGHDLSNVGAFDASSASVGSLTAGGVSTPARRADVVVWKDDEGTFHADGDDGRVASGADVMAVTQAAVDSLTDGRDWKETVLVASPGEATGEVDRIELPSYTVLDVPVRIHVPYPDGADHSEDVDYVVYAEDADRIEIPRLRITGAPWMGARLRGVTRTKIGDFRFVAPEDSNTDDGLRIDDVDGKTPSDVQLGSAYVENVGHHGVETVEVDRFQAQQIIGNNTYSTACLLNTTTDATINSVIGYETGSEEEAYATFRLANGNENISVGQVVSRGGYRGMAIITDARHVSIGEVDIQEPAWNGIQLVDAKNVTIGGGVIRNAGDEAVTIYSLNNEPVNEGITISDLRIVDDRDEPEQSWAIHESGQSRNNRFIDNDVRNGGTEGLIHVASETTVVRGNTGAGLDEGIVDLVGGADPAARVEGVTGAGSSALSARIQPTAAPAASAGWDTRFVWDGDDQEWDLVVEWTTDPGAGTTVEASYIVDRDQPNLAGIETGPPSEWNPDEVDQESGPGVVDDFEAGSIDEYVGATGSYDVTDGAPVAEGDFSLKNTGGSGLIGSFAGLPRYPAAGDTFAATVAQTGGGAASFVGVAFGMQDIDENFYFTRLDANNDSWQIWRVEDGDYEELASTDLTLDEGTLYDVVVDWSENGGITSEVRTTDGEVLASAEAPDEDTFLDGGFGTRRSAMLDDVRITERGSE